MASRSIQARSVFGVWKNGPWRSLDGTHPEVQRHLEHVFRTMRQAWDIRYFKLDGNYWGAIHGGRRHDPKATRVEAYRRGMETVVRGAGPGAIILRCHAPRTRLCFRGINDHEGL